DTLAVSEGGDRSYSSYPASPLALTPQHAARRRVERQVGTAAVPAPAAVTTTAVQSYASATHRVFDPPPEVGADTLVVSEGGHRTPTTANIQLHTSRSARRLARQAATTAVPNLAVVTVRTPPAMTTTAVPNVAVVTAAVPTSAAASKYPDHGRRAAPAPDAPSRHFSRPLPLQSAVAFFPLAQPAMTGSGPDSPDAPASGEKRG
ncbi:unnamed protein product, partial [Laminaria digitata]